MNNYTDTQLKQALAKMLLEKLEWFDGKLLKDSVEVLDTELLHLCWLVEETLDVEQWKDYCIPLGGRNIYWEGAKQMLHATWQQRTIALAKVKGVEL